METRWLPADKYDLNESNGAPEIPNEVWSLRTKHALKSFVGTFFALEFSLRFIWANEVPFSPADSSFTKILLLAFNITEK